MNTQEKFSNFLTSPELIKFYEQDPGFCDFVFNSFGHLVNHHHFILEYMGLPHGYGLAFRKDQISVVVGYFYDEIEPGILVSHEDTETYSQSSIEYLMKALEHTPEAEQYKYTAEYKCLGLIRAFLFKRKYKEQLSEEFWQKIRHAGEFLKTHFDEIMASLDTPELKERKTY